MRVRRLHVDRSILVDSSGTRSTLVLELLPACHVELVTTTVAVAPR